MSIIREFAKFIEPTGELEYDNTTSGLSATTIKSAIDELNTLLGGGNVGSQSTFSIYEFAASGGQTTFNLSSTFTVGGDVTAGDFITNETYKIQTTGTTDFTLIGALDSNPGTVFTATGAGAGTGTARVAVTYIPGYIQVYINGVFIASTDYTASDGQTVVLTEAAEASDLVTVVVLDSFNVATQLRVINVDASAPDDSLVIDNVGDVSVTSDIKLADNGKLILGDSSDLQIYSDGTTGQVTGNVDLTGTLVVNGSTAVTVSKGTTVQRPTGVAGMFRYNTTENKFEGYSTEWGEIGGGAAELLLNTFTGDGSDVTFTLSGAAAENNTLAYVDGVYQNKSTYTVSGATPAVVTFSEAPANGAAIEIMVATISVTNIGTPSDNTVTTAKIVDDAVTTVKLADDAVTAAKLASDVGGAFNNFVIKTADYTAVTRDQLIVNSASARTITLPASPSAGNVVFVKNAGAGTVTVARNGSNINSTADNGSLATDAAATLVYVDGTIGWKEL